VALGESARQTALTTSTLPERTRLRALAQEAFVRATLLVPASGYNWLGLARLQKDRLRNGEASPGDVDQAFDAALARDPRNASFLADAANAALEAGRLERGEELASRSASFYPDYGPPAGQLGLVDLIRGRPQEAYRRLERSLLLDWRGQEAARAVTLYNATAAAVAVGESAAAVRWARASLEIEPSSPEARYNLARALEGVGRADEARREYQTVVDLAPYHPVAERARQKLALSQ
jgi:tetratricopeptide (TPR) repeat protein